MRWRELLALALLACGGRERSTVTPDGARPDVAVDAGAPDLPVDTAPGPADTALGAAEFASMYCALLGPCCADAVQCRAAVGALAPYRAAMADGCLAPLRAVSATPDFCTAGYAATAQACERVFAAVTASKRLGEPCTENAQCQLSPQGPVRCAGVMGMGRCQVLMRGKEGSGPCVATVGGPLTVPAGDSMGNAIQGFLCHVADGLWCQDEGTQCAKTKPAGAACSSFGECGAGQYCDDVSGKCAARRAAGAACDVDEQCPSTLCGEDNRCAPPRMTDPAIAKVCVRP
jgi:hypothetical protein